MFSCLLIPLAAGVVVVVVVCLPGIENSLRPLDIAPYDLLSKLSIALIIVAGTGTGTAIT